MTLKRVAVLCAVAALTLGYQLLNKTMVGGWIPRLGIDDWVPLWPIWVFPYLLTLPGLLLAGISGARSMSDRTFLQFAATIAVAMLMCYACFAIIPSYVERPELAGSEYATALLRSLYAQDRPNNAFPSLHIALTVGWCFIWCNWRPSLTGLWVFITIVICLSTLLTRQHYVLDVAGGALVGWLAQRVARWTPDGRPRPV
jgi:membrane-associated phospholipid phosphatase